MNKIMAESEKRTEKRHSNFMRILNVIESISGMKKTQANVARERVREGKRERAQKIGIFGS